MRVFGVSRPLTAGEKDELRRLEAREQQILDDLKGRIGEQAAFFSRFETSWQPLTAHPEALRREERVREGSRRPGRTLLYSGIRPGPFLCPSNRRAVVAMW